MPVTIKTNVMKYKSSQGEYKEINAVSDHTAAEQIALIQSTGAAQVQAVGSAGTTQVGNVNSAGSTQITNINNRATEIENSWPSDYSELTDDVDDLKSAISVLEPAATNADIGKTLIANEVANGKVTEWIFGESGGGGISATAANLLLTILNEAVYGSDQSENLELLEKALMDIEPVSISAVLDCTPYVGLHYSDLKFIVTATFDDASTLVVDDYRIITPGSVTSGSNTVTVRFRFTTCDVTFTASTVQTYTITNNLTNVSTSNPAYLIEAGERYAAELTIPDTDHYISAYSITMGGTDITSTAYNNGNIVIAEVTGNVVITVTASEYTYLDPLITKRPYTNEGDTKVTLYSDKYATKVKDFAYWHIGKVTEYPAKYDCELYWEITNTSEDTIVINGSGNALLGFGMISGAESEYIDNNAIAYWEIVDNASHSLAPGASISGTYTLKAGWQLILTTSYNIHQALSERIRGNFVPDTFEDYSLLKTITNNQTDFPYVSQGYKTVNFYSDNGQTLIESVSGWYYKIDENGSAVEYDVIFRERYLSERGAGYSTGILFGFIDFDDSVSTYQSNFAMKYKVNFNRYNTWFPGRLKATNSGMVLVSNTIPNNANNVIDVFVKEVTQ